MEENFENNRGLASWSAKDKVMAILFLVITAACVVVLLNWATLFSMVACLVVVAFFWMYTTILFCRRFRENQKKNQYHGKKAKIQYEKLVIHF